MIRDGIEEAWLADAGTTADRTAAVLIRWVVRAPVTRVVRSQTAYIHSYQATPVCIGRPDWAADSGHVSGSAT
jgi:hypothetical protein